MRLITHNMLQSNISGVTNGFPLTIEAQTYEIQEIDFNPEFIQNMLPKLEWEALRSAISNLGLSAELPPADEVTDEMKQDEEFLKVVHHVLLEIHVQEGDLVCPETGRKFPVKGGIPNMLLHEDEV
ncbi:unnamed protein product [Heterosigma akashiwo]|mmetsp:Transcript_35207/g.63995  ORF Transcript_35207/g.63995 Transcript_35207/m.63995 type:complete len:126 (+) Transcript_35207:47-424(+)